MMKAKALAIFILSFLFIVVIAGCANAQEKKVNQENKVTWDKVFAPPECRANKDAPLLDGAFAQAGLDRKNLGFTTEDLRESPYFMNGYLEDEFTLPWFRNLRAKSAYVGCFEGEVVGALDYYLPRPHPVASMINHAASLLGSQPSQEPPINPAHLSSDFSQAINALCVSAGECGEATGEVPKELVRVLTPIIWAIIDGVEARKKMDNEIGNHHNADWWTKYGGNILLPTRVGRYPDFLNDEDRVYLLGRGGRQDLYRAAAKIAYAIEHVDWGPFIGQKGIKYDLHTKAGWIRIRDGSDDLYLEDSEDVLFLLDLGGNDEHLDAVASNKSGANPVSIAVDLSGNDKYYYQAYKTAADREGLLPADWYGRYRGDERSGPFSISDECRQGAARNGIAMLFDFSKDDDYYLSPRCSQGYAHLGVGVLFDDGGNDAYLAEIASQGSAQFGIGLLIDAGLGNDLHRSFIFSQGFGYVAGVGILFDEEGNDSYSCDNGDPEQGGIPLYYSPQLPGKGNASFCQGAGLGNRGEDQNRQTFLSGGLGILRDKNGNDVYDASVFAQGTGYWQGTGLLSDGGGSDRYDAYWYVQGAAAHFAVGILADAGDGDDIFNGTRPSRAVNLGAGHDFSIGVLINERGNDTYHIDGSVIAAGASNCNGIGLFVDNSGDDKYFASSDYGSGMGNVSGECIESRPNARSIGIMIDAGGKDVYSYPDSQFPIPGDNKTWGHKRNGLESEYGVGIDGEGETGIHAESAR